MGSPSELLGIQCTKKYCLKIYGINKRRGRKRPPFSFEEKALRTQYNRALQHLSDFGLPA